MPTTEEMNYAILETYLEKGTVAAVRQARFLFSVTLRSAHDKVKFIVHQAGGK